MIQRNKKDKKKILISRIDAIGDVILTLPMAGYLKNHSKEINASEIVFGNKKKEEDIEVFFLGSSYTRAVVTCSGYVDHFLDYSMLRKRNLFELVRFLRAKNLTTFIHVFPNFKLALAAFLACIPERIGTSRRWYHWLFCNKWPSVSRKTSSFHEAQLNLSLLAPLFSQREVRQNKKFIIPSVVEIPSYYGFPPAGSRRFLIQNKLLASLMAKYFSSDLTKVIIHPFSKGSAREWPLNQFAELINSLSSKKFQVFLTGSKEDSLKIKERLLPLLKNKKVHDLSGTMSLEELVTFISCCDVLVAASTGPLHIAAASGIWAFGLYPPRKSIHPGRWSPLGNKTKVFCFGWEEKILCERPCQPPCFCMERIEVKNVLQALEDVRKDEKEKIKDPAH